MPQKFKHKDAVARLRQRQGIALHHLLRPGETVRDHDHRPVCGGLRISGDGGLPDGKLLDLNALTREFEHTKR